jgi:hypothetical protein
MPKNTASNVTDPGLYQLGTRRLVLGTLDWLADNDSDLALLRKDVGCDGDGDAEDPLQAEVRASSRLEQTRTVFGADGWQEEYARTTDYT